MKTIMPGSKIKPPPLDTKDEPRRQHVIDAAERLLHEGKADFSMRDLAAEAGVSFATPFNQFGSEAAIVQALSGQRIDALGKRFVACPSSMTRRIACCWPWIRRSR